VKNFNMNFDIRKFIIIKWKSLIVDLMVQTKNNIGGDLFLHLMWFPYIYKVAAALILNKQKMHHNFRNEPIWGGFDK
jgi:hypothetical protein